MRTQSRAASALLVVWTLLCQPMATYQQPRADALMHASRSSAIATSPASNTGGLALVRHAATINGNARVEGSLRQLSGESVVLNGGVISGDLQVPGTPKLTLNGNPTFGGTIQGTGSALPSNYQVVMNGNSTLGRLINRTDPIPLANVPLPPSSPGTRNVITYLTSHVRPT